MSQPLAAVVVVLVIAVLAAYVVAAVIRFNQLSLAQGLAVESLRQLQQALSERHGLVPSFARAVADAKPGADAGAHLDRALADAQTALTGDTPHRRSSTNSGDDRRAQRRNVRWPSAHAATVGRNEHHLGSVIHAAWMPDPQQTIASGGTDPRAQASSRRAADLYAQLLRCEDRISVAMRYFNRNVRAYNAKRHGLTALVLRARFRRWSEVPQPQQSDVSASNPPRPVDPLSAGEPS